ncbi:hypothetical protein L202_06387 [Cryptococcus amylolentus CBS 6039]|uniref:Uncharacterized protein n=1 Tax=Cryptococcus amylolentus CBS 6039 TaxID=1295533 RepID=A0A1E3HFP8_9TREE|nr:hypothetical protein L202_06387 [Cryptococcus amylolentus CBS 6039]ODN75189.1 hypothetical protein L202_06387 [Cryptococcus amylolentus CBS 6039]
MSDDDLFARFAALRAPASAPSSPPLHTVEARRTVDEVAKKAREEDEELERIASGMPTTSSFDVRSGKDEDDDELARRIARLRGNEAVEDEGDSGEQDMESFLREISASQHLPTASEESDEQMIARAFASVRQDRLRPLSPANGSDSGQEYDGPSEEEVISRALDEAKLDKDKCPPSPDIGEQEEIPGLSFPSLPSHVPQEEDDTDGEARRRLELLMGLEPSPAQVGNKSQLPSVPKTKPTYDLPGYNSARDEDTDTWCCICSKDATLQCIDCDDDLYCEECWRDGHGVAEGQERGHRVKRFNWDGKRPVAV